MLFVVLHEINVKFLSFSCQSQVGLKQKMNNESSPQAGKYTQASRTRERLDVAELFGHVLKGRKCTFLASACTKQKGPL